jgi:Na+-driven multidrug efflux pump
MFQKVAALSLVTSGIFGIFTALPLVLYPGPILRFIGAPDELVEAGSVYFQLFSAAAPLIVMSAVGTATFRSLNDSKTPMFVTMGAVGLNTLLGLFLVFGWGPFPKLGVVGAGLATLIAQFARYLVLLIALYRKEKGLTWHWPLPGTGIAKVFRPLLEITKLLILLPSANYFGDQYFCVHHCLNPARCRRVDLKSDCHDD